MKMPRKNSNWELERDLRKVKKELYCVLRKLHFYETGVLSDGAGTESKETRSTARTEPNHGEPDAVHWNSHKYTTPTEKVKNRKSSDVQQKCQEVNSKSSQRKKESRKIPVAKPKSLQMFLLILTVMFFMSMLNCEHAGTKRTYQVEKFLRLQLANPNLMYRPSSSNIHLLSWLEISCRETNSGLQDYRTNTLGTYIQEHITMMD